MSKEEEIQVFLNRYLYDILSPTIPIETLMTYFSDRICGFIGTSKNEMVISKDNIGVALKLRQTEILDSLKEGLGYIREDSDIHQDIQFVNEVVLVTRITYNKLRILSTNEIYETMTRLTATLEKVDSEWKFLQIHISRPEILLGENSFLSMKNVPVIINQLLAIFSVQEGDLSEKMQEIRNYIIKARQMLL